MYTLKSRKIKINKFVCLFTFFVLITFNFQLNAYALKEVHHTQNWIENSNFNSLDSWFYLQGGDVSDVNTKIQYEQGHFEILGEKKEFSLVADPPLALNWTESSNPIYHNRPQEYNITTDGCRVYHLFNDQTAVTNPSIQWDTNISLSENISDYIITSASIKAIVYANASLDIDRANDTECRNDLWREIDTYDVGDYVQFYVLVSDLEKEKIYEIAYFQTEDLGTGNPPGGAPGWDILNDTYMISYPEEDLIFYLSSVLNTDYRNFTLTVGMLLHFEDNCVVDWDYDEFNELIIKYVNLTFSYEKKIDQSTSISFNQNLSKLSDESENKIEIMDARLYFKYKIDQNWTKSSPNTEIRILINNIRIPETIELIDYNYTSFFQDAKIEGFNIKSLISEQDDALISIQLYLADVFELDRVIIISIDDIFLEISYIEFIPTSDNSILILWILISILLVIIGILGALSLRSYFFIPRKTKRASYLLLRTQKFKDINNIQGILLIHRSSGLPIYSRTYSTFMKGKKTLFSGFIQALSIIGDEISNNEPKKTKDIKSIEKLDYHKIIELDLKTFYCLILDIGELRTVLILKSHSSKRLKQIMFNFTLALYLKITKRLENFNNDTTEYPEVITPLLDEYFELFYKENFITEHHEKDIESIKKKYKLTKIQLQIMHNIFSVLSEKRTFRLMDIIEKFDDKNEDLIIDAMETLIDYKLIIPYT
ncbi:MAG: hypothetical protein ACFFFT_06125 [Candidatus Thorarchaeota archaeon]